MCSPHVSSWDPWLLGACSHHEDDGSAPGQARQHTIFAIHGSYFHFSHPTTKIGGNTVSQGMGWISLATLVIRHDSFYVTIFQFLITVLMPEIVLYFQS